MITEGAEVKHWNWLKNKMKKEKVDFQRIENTTGGGVPDVNGCCKGREAWIELKVFVKGNVVLRKEQYAWIVRRAHTHCGNVMVMAYDPVNKRIEIFYPKFEVRKWGNTGKYVAITSPAQYVCEKTVNSAELLRAIFWPK